MKPPKNTRKGLAVMNANKPLAALDKSAFAKDCIDRYLNGTDLIEIAHEHQVTTERLYQVLIEHAETEWRSAQAAKALKAYAEAEKALENAPDGLSLARARERIRSCQWNLERVLRRIYGQDAPQVQVNININDIAGKIAQLEAELLGKVVE